MFSKNKKATHQESVSERRNRIMAQVFEQMNRRKESAIELIQAQKDRDDWSNRLALVELKLRKSPDSGTLQFLRAQALLNYEIAKENHDAMNTKHQKMVTLTKGATEALESLERIALAEATREALKNHRTSKLSTDNDATELVQDESVRELIRAEHYVKALTELTLEDTK